MSKRRTSRIDLEGNPINFWNLMFLGFLEKLNHVLEVGNYRGE